MHIYPDRSGYKLYAVIILATGSCFLKYDPPLSTVDSIVSKKRYVLIRFHYMHVYYLHTCVDTDRVFYIYLFIYMSVIHILVTFQALGFSGPKICS